jgi:cell division protease FtsH
MCSALGGRAAEQIAFGKISTGALSDLEKVTKQAYAMVSIYGLNEKLGNISYYDSQGRDAFTKPYSDETARVIDEEVSKLIETQYQRALEILGENKDKLTQLAELLLAREVIFKEDLIAIFGKRPWEKEEEEQSSPEEVNLPETNEILDQSNEQKEEETTDTKPESEDESSSTDSENKE